MLVASLAHAEEATGKLVWVDAKNSSLLLECPDKGCPSIPDAKPGETYTFVIPAKMKAAVASLKEGETVTLVYNDAKEKGYVITSVKK
jgi:hypothetical protein